MNQKNKRHILWKEYKYAESFTLSDAVALIGRDIYCNAEKHVGALLSRMVKSGALKRITNGVFTFIKFT